MNRNRLFLLVLIFSINSLNAAIPKTFQEYFQQANRCFKEKKHNEAIDYYNKAIKLNPNCHQAYFNKGLAQLNSGDKKNAELSYLAAINIYPNYEKAHLMLGNLLKDTGKYEQACEQYREMINLNQNNAQAHQFLGRALSDRRLFDEALEHLQIALSLDPNSIQCKLDYANALNMSNNPEHALILYKELQHDVPNNPSITYNIAYTLKKLGRIHEAFEYYHRAVELNPNHAEAHFGLGIAYIMVENFKDGWQEYEWRWEKPGKYQRNFKKPVWDGENLYGKTILLHAEQGLGDTFQFIRFAQIAKELGGTVVVASQNPLTTILKSCPYIDKVVPLGGFKVPFDTHAPLMSLPKILEIEVDTIPTDIPYLFADEELVEFWKRKLSKDKNFKIGICWQGNPNYSTPFLRNAVAAKSIQLLDLTPISEIPGVKLYCLQKMTGEEQLKNIPDDFNLHVFEGDFDNSHGRFMDTAAVMKNLDLVLTVDTSVAHLAGGLGVPVWLILPEPADWRWMLRETDSPWYPHMRLFRQPEPEDWDSVIQTVVQELKKLIDA